MAAVVKRKFVIRVLVISVLVRVAFNGVAPLFSQDVLRGEVSEELEPLYALFLGVSSPISAKTAALWALEDSALAFSGMIYGWDFEYSPGEVGRGRVEYLDLKPLPLANNNTSETSAAIRAGDPRLRVTDTRIEDGVFFIFCDYRLSDEQRARLLARKSADVLRLSAVGYAPLHGVAGTKTRCGIKFSALCDAMKRAIRGHLRLSLKNRPALVRGSIALESFPIYRIENGHWQATTRLVLRIKDVEPYSTY
jgi:hypothetical protein